MHNIPGGDHRFYNNLFVGGTGLSPYGSAALPMRMAGNVFLGGAKPAKQEAEPIVLPEFAPEVKLLDTADGHFLKIALGGAWAEQPRPLVTTDLLGKAWIPDLPFEQPDGSAYRLDRDYFGQPRNASSPTPGPLALKPDGTHVMKVWPKE